MPVWHEKTRALRASGRLTVIGVAQEQHPDRCRLFAQWHGIDWPILWDPFNVTGTKVVPRTILLDEHGIVRSLRAQADRLEADFLDREFAAPETPDPVQGKGPRASLPQALEGRTSPAVQAYYRALSDLLWNVGNGDTAMEALRDYAAGRPQDAAAQWRLGVAYRMRHDSGERHDGDFHKALTLWQRALAADPSQYIVRRRLQQYGPRLDKPYPFYPWVEEARAAIRARGQAPVELAAALTGAERAAAGRIADGTDEKEPDPGRRIEAPAGLLHLDAAIAWNEPNRRRRGDAARVHLVLRPSGNRVLLWEAEAGPVTVWLELPEGWRTESRLLRYTLKGTDRAEEQATLDFEVGFPEDRAQAGVIRGYALYHACLDQPGECRYLRHDFEIPVPARR